MEKVQEQLIKLALQAEKEDTNAASAAVDIQDKELPGLVARHLLPMEYFEKWPLQQDYEDEANNNNNNSNNDDYY